MSAIMEECVNHPKIKALVKTFATKMTRCLSDTMSFEDARQELLTGLLWKINKFDPSRSNLPTFAYYVIRTTAANRVRILHQYIDEHNLSLKDEILGNLIDYNMESRIVDKMLCDQIENDLDGIAKSVFSILRSGISKAVCADMLRINRSYVSRLLEKKIKRVVNKYKFI